MNQNTDCTPAALYARVSSDRQDVDLSISAQLRALRDYARKNGYIVAREYIDEAESGRIADRPEFRKMIDEAARPNAAFQEILVWKFSRFTRKREHAVAFKSMLRRKGVRVVSITEHADDTPTGKLLEGIIESVDEFYSENLAQEVTRGMREAASRGFWIGSRTPYGYNRIMVQDGAKKRPTLEPDPDASRVVKRIFDMAEAGTGMLHIARALNDEGIASPTGKLWSKNGIHFILRNEVYTGTLIWGANAKDKADPIRIEKAFPAIISKAKSQRVNRLMRSRAPKIAHPRRVGSTYLLSGLVKCHRCNRALSGQDAKSGQFSYYVCQSIMKRGKDACDTPRLNARRFEELVIGKIRSNVLTEGNIRALVKVVDEQMDGVAREQRKRLETIEDELEDVKRKLGRIWHFVETTDIDMADASDRIKEHRERQERLEDAAADARAILSQRRAVLDDVNTIAAYAQDMSEFLNESELTERRAFIETFVKEIVVMPGEALLRYTIPMPDDSPIPGRNAEEMVLNGSVLSTVKNGGPDGTRTLDARMRSHAAVCTSQLHGMDSLHLPLSSSAPKAGSNPVSLVCIGPAILLFPIPQRIPYTCCMTLLLTRIGDASAPLKTAMKIGFVPPKSLSHRSSLQAHLPRHRALGIGAHQRGEDQPDLVARVDVHRCIEIAGVRQPRELRGDVLHVHLEIAKAGAVTGPPPLGAGANQDRPL